MKGVENLQVQHLERNFELESLEAERENIRSNFDNLKSNSEMQISDLSLEIEVLERRPLMHKAKILTFEHSCTQKVLCTMRSKRG